jgi:hypothetical protein
MYRYDPVREIDIEDLADDGCGKRGDRLLTNAEINQVYEDSVVLWDGREPDSTYTLHIRGPGMVRKTKSLVGKSRYERAYDALQEVMREEDEVTVTFVCKGERKAPVATRVSFRAEDGDEIAYEF